MTPGKIKLEVELSNSDWEAYFAEDAKLTARENLGGAVTIDVQNQLRRAMNEHFANLPAGP